MYLSVTFFVLFEGDAQNSRIWMLDYIESPYNKNCEAISFVV